MSVTLDSLDHLVLTVTDIPKACSFYAQLGMTVVTFGEGRVALSFGRQKINLHEIDCVFPPTAAQVQTGSADLCFLTRTPLPEVISHLNALRITVIEGPVRRTGATGPLESVYVRDPDGNLVEIANALP